MDEKVSVIVPIYNVEQYLDRCVVSIVNQSYKNLEIILVNDGSPDGCGAMCDLWASKDERIIVIHKENGGVSTARNAGLDVCSGEYITFADPDDYLHLEMIETLLRKKHPDADIVICNYIQLKDGKENYRSTGKDMLLTSEEFYNHYWEYSDTSILNCPWNKLYVAKLFMEYKLRYEPRYITAQDLALNVEYYEMCKNLQIIYDYLYYYSDNVDSVTNTYKELRFDILLEIYQKRISSVRMKKTRLVDVENNLERKSMIYLYAFCIESLAKGGKELKKKDKTRIIQYYASKKEIKEALSLYRCKVKVNGFVEYLQIRLLQVLTYCRGYKLIYVIMLLYLYLKYGRGEKCEP